MTLWADVSQYQPLADDTYPHRAFCFRTNSGSAQDINADANAAWAKQALDDGRLDIVIGYYFFGPVKRTVTFTGRSSSGRASRNMTVSQP